LLFFQSYRIQKWQRRIQRLLTFAPLLVQGRGVFSYSSGLVPHRRPITTVVGVPIVIEKDLNPDREKVQKYHKMYKDAILELFNNYRDIYDPKAKDIEFVD
jgi:2-acylglycerol O-acyltransferase 2